MCGDCVAGARAHLRDESVDLLICDPPFGIGEASFGKHYNRKRANVLAGYVQAPADYAGWTCEWMAEARRVLKPHGVLYVVSGHTNLRHILNAADELRFSETNHIIWKYNFGVYARRKFVTSHYHVLCYSKSPKARPIFNTNCHFGDDERDEQGRSLLYRDLEDVWHIKREYRRGTMKNANKLPEALVKKMIAYSSNPGDVVGDFFLGNFTTARVAKRMGRAIVGFEINPVAFEHFAREFRAGAAHAS